MAISKRIVCISASFEKKNELLRILKKYAHNCDERFAYWNEFAFTSKLLPECNALLIFNTPRVDIKTNCYPENVIAFMMEPGIANEHPWMFKNLSQYHTVFSPINESENTILSHGFLGWHFDRDYKYLKNLEFPNKVKAISCIASDLQQLPGHRLRFSFIKTLDQHFPQIDFFGRGRHFLSDKLDGLLSYRYSIAIENTSQPYYFTEKINDCFLTYTVPIYYGCKNLDQYFPPKSYIPIDITNPVEAVENIKAIVKYDDWNARIKALKEARELVLEKYHPLAGAAEILRQIHPSSARKEIVLKPVFPGLIKSVGKTLFKLIN